MNAIFSAAADWSWQNLMIAMAHTLWQSAAIAALLWLPLRLLPARFASLRYLACVGALVMTLLLGLATWSALDHVHPKPFASLPVSAETSESPAPAISVDSPIPLVTSSSTPTPQAPIAWPTLAGWTWLCGAALLLTRTATGVARAQQRVAIGRPITDGPLHKSVTTIARRMRIGRTNR